MDPLTVEPRAQEATTSSLVDGWQDHGKFVQLVHDLADTRNEPQPVAEASTPYAVRNVEEEVATPGTALNLEKVEFSVSEYLPIGSPAVTHDAQESGEIRDNQEMMRAMNNFVEANIDWRPKRWVADFLFFAGLEKHGLRVDWTTVDKSRNIREIPVAERHAARVELWKRKTVFRGSLLYPQEPTLRTDERVPRKPRAKKTSPAGSTPAEDDTVPATKKTAKRKLNLDPPMSRSPSPEALEPLGKSEREKRQWGYIDKFINETVQDKIQKRERELKEQIEALEAKNAELQRQLREACDALADAMVGRRESSEPNHAAGPSIDPVEISSDRDDKKGAETHEPTVASTALGSTKRVAKKPQQRSARKPGNY
ncbi:hypothetical protein R1sor_009504 [Riccia sorocarpa]|uniref:Transposase n=1 Tax=Riccia sorocarpa TaxID=122646 RepID=A0ABD3HVE3_9MARC